MNDRFQKLIEEWCLQMRKHPNLRFSQALANAAYSYPKVYQEMNYDLS